VTIIYRTAGAWGAGKGSNVTPAEVDQNFYEHDQRIVELEENPPTAVSIASIDVTGNILTITLTNNDVLGPFVLPAARFRWTGAWQPDLQYQENDTFSHDLSLYVVLQDHTSDATFDATRFDSVGFFYQELLAVPDAFMDIGFFYPGSPGALIASGQPMFAYRCVRDMFLPEGLESSRAGFGQANVHDLSFSIQKNGVEIGTWDTTDGFTFAADVQLVAGDVLSVVGPALQYDEEALDLTMTLVAVRGLIP
jgi:hypothetical protein